MSSAGNLTPWGFIRYSIEYPDEVQPAPAATTPLPPAALTLLGEVNRYWNVSITPLNERVWLSMSGADINHWHVFLTSGQSGVCHDYACTKRHALAQYPGYAGSLALAWLHRDADEARVDHMVLLVRTESGILVLDSLFRDPYPLEDSRGYEWIGRQDWGNPLSWVPVQ